MIRIRYRDSSAFSPGLHAAAERHGRTTTLYLLSGLTAPERRSVLRRLRLSARMGHCPRLPVAPLAIALFADGIRTAIGRAGAVLRLHPAGSTVPVMVLSGGAIAFLLFSTVSIRVLPSPQTDAQSWTSAGAVPIPGRRMAGRSWPDRADPRRPGTQGAQVGRRRPRPRPAGQAAAAARAAGTGTGARPAATRHRQAAAAAPAPASTLSEHADPTPAPAAAPRPEERPRRPPPRRNPRQAPRRAPAPSA